AQHGVARRAVESGNTKMSLWNLCVAQVGLTRRASRKFKLDWRNGYLPVAQDRWRGAPVREIVQNLAFIMEKTVSFYHT
ncbi:hypothetical protein A2U01_0084430, partial [Trifolium medium]|nr:hypothetical protein [Trifolium medium]